MSASVSPRLETRTESSRLPETLRRNEEEILKDWVRELASARTRREDLINDSEVRDQCRHFLSLFQQAVQSGNLTDVSGPEWSGVRDMLTELSRTRVSQGFSPSEIAAFILSLKSPIFTSLRAELAGSQDQLFQEVWVATILLDQLALFTGEVYQRAREEVIHRQQSEMLELSTPVVKLWEGILALPMIGTLDSNRTQIVMETLLQRIVETGAEVAIIDITGVPTVDTLVAQHLIKTVSAARLMGADCIISGVRPQIAQTMVHLAVDLKDIVTKATLADAFLVALQRTGFTFSRHATGMRPAAAA